MPIYRMNSILFARILGEPLIPEEFNTEKEIQKRTQQN
jgi:hypothetical protein